MGFLGDLIFEFVYFFWRIDEECMDGVIFEEEVGDEVGEKVVCEVEGSGCDD